MQSRRAVSRARADAICSPVASAAGVAKLTVALYELAGSADTAYMFASTRPRATGATTRGTGTRRRLSQRSISPLLRLAPPHRPNPRRVARIGPTFRDCVRTRGHRPLVKQQRLYIRRIPYYLIA
jgi:hypothetical protein